MGEKMKPLKMKRVRPEGVIPRRATEGSAGYDLCAVLGEPTEIPIGETLLIPTGLAMAIPKGYAGFVFARSGLGIKYGIALANGVGVIDSDYRGEVMVGLRNYSTRPFVVEPGDRIAQLVLLPVFLPEIEEWEDLEETSRGAGGFGSTGKQVLEGEEWP